MGTRAASAPIGKSHRVAVRGWTGVVLGAAGAVLFVLGWYGASGEALVAAQVPYLASASLPGAALVVAGAVLLNGELARRSDERAAEMIEVLYGLLTETGPEPERATTRPPATSDELVALADARRYHRPHCALVAGKAPAVVGPDEIAARLLAPCPVCEPLARPG